ncbi:MAG TPA: hypothetical protein VKF81_05980 [Blastocatellia bacterium]|nr:hypothetical protein [Blastocatellia bacterium]
MITKVGENTVRSLVVVLCLILNQEPSAQRGARFLQRFHRLRLSACSVLWIRSLTLLHSDLQRFRALLLSAYCTVALVAMTGTGESANATAVAQRSGDVGQRAVYINRTRLADQWVFALEGKYRVRIPDGSYWYDRMSGAWGVEGGPTAGFIHAGLDLGGQLRADASRGKTGVFINGRELHALDVRGLQRLGPVYRGRYWVDAQGNFGFEGGPALGNLVWLAQQGGLLPGRARRGSILSGMYDSGIGRVLGNGDFYISDNSYVTH